MEILDLNIKSFGKFSDHQISFSPGINVIYGGNESGKSTVSAFIRAMFFGLNRGRGRAANLDEYQLRQPWDAPGAFLGSLRFSQDGKVYRIDRCFDRSTTPLSLTCETDAKEYTDPQTELDALLGGISETAFCNTVFVPQMQVETDEALAGELRHYMINSDTAMDGEIDVTQALQSLRKKKKEREQELKKDAAGLDEQIEAKQEQADRLRTRIEQLRAPGGPADSLSGVSQSERRRRELPYADDFKAEGPDDEEPDDKEPDEEEPARTVSPGARRLLCVMLALAAVLTAVGIFLSESVALSVFLGVFTVIFGGMAFGVYFLFRPEMEEEEGEEAPEPSEELQEELRACEEEYRNTQEDLEVLYRQHTGPEVPDTTLDALNLAIDRICEISSGIFQTNGGRLNETASQILSEITQGRYNRITIDDTAQIRIHTPLRVLDVSQVSGGTMQQIYFALRMAAQELLCRDESLPVILDETFAMFDDARLESALAWLKKSGKQVIIFTCQSREREILKRI